MTDAASCDYCGLPLPAWLRPQGGAGGRFCCSGCRFAAEVTRAAGESGANRAALLKVGAAIFCTMNVVAFTMALWTQDLYPADAPQRLAAVLQDLFRYLGLLFSAPVLLLLGQPLLESALAQGRRTAAATDWLVLGGVAAAFAFSAVSVVRGAGPVYFEVACVVLVLITLGRWLEAQGKLQATAALENLQRLLPEAACRIDGDQEQTIPLREVRIGDRLRVRPGERVPTDGRIVAGTAHIDEQWLTGESWPRARQAGEDLLAGSHNLDGDLVVVVTAPPGSGALAQLLDCLRQARLARGRSQRLAEQVVAWFLPTVAALALATTVWHGLRSGWPQGVMTGLSVALIACPCALGLATPLAVWAALGAAARRHVLFRSGAALERCAEIRAVAWDKTGTLTTGAARLERVLADAAFDEADAVAQQFLAEGAALAAASSHPFSKALVQAAGGAGRMASAGEVRQIPGRGLTGRAPDGRTLVLGSVRWLEELGLEWSDDLRSAATAAVERGDAVVALGAEGAVRAVFVFAEDFRPGAAAAVRWLHEYGYVQRVFTGDHRMRADRVARELAAAAELPEVLVEAELLPAQKVAAVKALQGVCGPTAMIGDGVNDAPALAAAHVGISLGNASDLSRDQAGVCLLGGDLEQLPWALKFARRTVRIIRQNLFWAFGYNSVGVGLACAGYLNPAVAALLMTGSSVFVIANSLRLLRDEPTMTTDVGTTPVGSTQELAAPRLEGAALEVAGR